MAHPSPNSIMLLGIEQKEVKVQLQLPLTELELAFGKNLTQKPNEIIRKYGNELQQYILFHFKPKSEKLQPWQVKISGFELQKMQKVGTNYYQDLIVNLLLTPPNNENVKPFYLNYDGIVHQVVTHSILVTINKDWSNGVFDEKPIEIGAISLDLVNNVLPPFMVALESGSNWKGFKGMFNLGVKHIAEGTDHLLFLLTLLLPSMLLVNGKKWGNYIGLKKSILKLLKVVTAFTVGHSITLLIGAFDVNFLPTKWIEVLIGVSILVSAIHAIRPIFPGKEIYIAAGFGLIHGLAFANTLVDLNLDNTKLLLSVLGFNLGIEFIQLIVILIVIPFLILMAKSDFYKIFRITLAILAIIAACGWIAERINENPNFVTNSINNIVNHPYWLLIGLVFFTSVSFVYDIRKSFNF